MAGGKERQTWKGYKTTAVVSMESSLGLQKNFCSWTLLELTFIPISPHSKSTALTQNLLVLVSASQTEEFKLLILPISSRNHFTVTIWGSFNSESWKSNIKLWNHMKHSLLSSAIVFKLPQTSFITLSYLTFEK